MICEGKVVRDTGGRGAERGGMGLYIPIIFKNFGNFR